MAEPNPIGTARSLLRDAITEFQPPPCDPLTISPWIAMSLMQKAIRRGRKDLALRAAATLLHGSPERLWRRLGCIAFEDIGVADLDTAALVTAALAGKRFRSELGGEWSVASFLVSRLSEATKCRAADDLLLASENHPDFQDERLAFAFRRIDDLRRISRMIGRTLAACWSASALIEATVVFRAFASSGPPSATPRALAAASAALVRVLIIARSFSANAANRCRMNGSTSAPSSATCAP